MNISTEIYLTKYAFCGFRLYDKEVEDNIMTEFKSVQFVGRHNILNYFIKNKLKDLIESNTGVLKMAFDETGKFGINFNFPRNFSEGEQR